MNIAIIGAGSIGMLIASYLKEAGNELTMLVRDEGQKDILREKGIFRLDQEGKTIQPVQATTTYSDIARVDGIVVAVKYKDLQEVLEQLRQQGIRKPILFVQNGIAHLEDVKEEDFPIAAFATVEHGALKEGQQTVHHNGVGPITIGIRFGKAEAFDFMTSAHQAKFPIHWHADPTFILLRKVLVNCLINPLTTILGVQNGVLLESPHTEDLMRRLYDELVEAFPKMKEALPFEDVKQVCHQTATNHSSMLTDYRQGRLMEVDTIVSAVVTKAEQAGKSVPLLKTYEQLLLFLNKQVDG